LHLLRPEHQLLHLLHQTLVQEDQHSEDSPLDGQPPQPVQADPEAHQVSLEEQGRGLVWLVGWEADQAQVRQEWQAG
jgi:hypothetical protein